MRRRQLVRTLLAAPMLSLVVRAAGAAEQLVFSQDGFAAAQAAGRPILIHIWASWCPICAKQGPTLAEIALDPKFGAMAMFKVDFDHDKDIVRGFGARMQSTLIVFHGAKETGRSVGETAPEKIRALVATGLG